MSETKRSGCECGHAEEQHRLNRCYGGGRICRLTDDRVLCPCGRFVPVNLIEASVRFITNVTSGGQ